MLIRHLQLWSERSSHIGKVLATFWCSFQCNIQGGRCRSLAGDFNPDVWSIGGKGNTLVRKTVIKHSQAEWMQFVMMMLTHSIRICFNQLTNVVITYIFNYKTFYMKMQQITRYLWKNGGPLQFHAKTFKDF